MGKIKNIAVVGNGITSEAEYNLKARGYDCVILPSVEYLAKPVSNHADMLVCPVGDRIFAHSAYARGIGRQALTEICRMTGRKLYCIEAEASAEYPHDVGLNCALIGHSLLVSKYTYPEIIEYAESIGISVIYSNQGYARCSVVPVGENALITSDDGIAKAVGRQGIEVLKVRSGDVLLPGYDCGFLGGCTGFDGENVYINGALRFHSDGEAIETFCGERGYGVVSLADFRPTDIGSIFFI